MLQHLEKTLCPLCEHTGFLKHPAQEGYQSKTYFAIYHCLTCSTAFAHPSKIDHSLYDLIYCNSHNIPGYERYFRYAQEVVIQENPLEYLAIQEDVYWAIKKHLNSLKKSHPKILEVGCGLGYLTYSLRKAGYDATGLDISYIAIEQAKQRYGDFYICKDVSDYAKSTGAIYDVIIFTEVIEHIPNIHSFLSSLSLLLKPDGELVLTTPNRSCYSDNVLWETEPPPVHLWWFSEHSIERLAKRFGYYATFIDYTEYNKNPFYIIVAYDKPFVPTRTPRIDIHGKVIDPMKPPRPQKKWKKFAKAVLKQFGLLSSLRKIRDTIYRFFDKPEPLIGLKLPVDPKRRAALCAILKKEKS